MSSRPSPSASRRSVAVDSGDSASLVIPDVGRFYRKKRRAKKSKDGEDDGGEEGKDEEEPLVLSSGRGKEGRPPAPQHKCDNSRPRANACPKRGEDEREEVGSPQLSPS